MQRSDESLPPNFEYRLDLARQVTSYSLRQEAIHRWFYFQHSFSPKLVEQLFDTFQLPVGAMVVDPFVGAGTTLAVARQRGICAIGTDLSPLSVFVSNAKIGAASESVLRAALRSVMEASLDRTIPVEMSRPSRLKRAFTDAEFDVLRRLQESVFRQVGPEQEILLLALLRTARKFSRAVPDGGWFRWRELPSGEAAIRSWFQDCVEEMLEDIAQIKPASGCCRAYRHDARELGALAKRESILSGGCDAIICSPPYPNRHDYTRIYQIELLMLGSTEEEIFELRRASLRSHVEAHAPSGITGSYSTPGRLVGILDLLPQKGLDRRVRSMLEGYFEDLAAVLRSGLDILKTGGHFALVVGNVRHGGVMIPVDEILMEIGEGVGLAPVVTWVARLRGNSAQQMGKFGRQPARESVVIFRKEQAGHAV